MTDIIKIIDPCSDPRWDKFVENHPFGWIVHLSGWKKVLESTFPHIKGHYLALIDKDTDVIKAGLPIYEVRSWLTGNRLVSVPFATISDPLVFNKQQSDLLICEAIQLLERLMFSYIEIRTLRSVTLHSNDQFRFNCDNKYHCLDLAEGINTIWKNLSYKSVRYEINKAKKTKVELKVADNEEDLKSFYRLYAMTRKRLGLPAQPYHFFKALFDTFFQSHFLEIHLATIEGKAIGGHLYFRFNRCMSAEAVGDDVAYRNNGINHFLYWEGIRSACASEYQTFDFGRTSIYNKTLMDFKKRWGTTETDLPTYYYDCKQKIVNATNRETSMPYTLIRYMCKNAPMSVQAVLSRFCYRHLG